MASSSSDGEGCVGCGCLVIIAVGIFFAYNAYNGSSSSKASSSSTLPSLTKIIDFSRRASALDADTSVLILKNKTGEYILDMSMLLEDQNTLGPKKDANGKPHLYERHKDYQPPPLIPHGSIEIGILETGWLLKADTVVTISLKGYEDQSIYFYKDGSGRLQMALSYSDKKAAQLEEKGSELLKWLHDAVK